MLYIINDNDRGDDRAVSLSGNYRENMAKLSDAIGSKNPLVVSWIAGKAVASARGDTRGIAQLLIDTVRLIETYTMRDAHSINERALDTQACLGELAYRLLHDALSQCFTNVYVSRNELNRMISDYERVTGM